MKTLRITFTTVMVLAILVGQAKAWGYGRDGGGDGEGLARPVFFIPPVPRPVFPHQSGIVCREFIVQEGVHGNFREVTRTVCRDRHGKHFDRHHWQGDDRRYWRGDDRDDWRDDRRHGRRGHGGGRNRW